MYQRSPSLVFDRRNSLWRNLLCCVPFFGKGSPDLAYDLSRFKSHATLRNNPSYIVGDKLGVQVPDFVPGSSQNGKIPRGIFTWDGIVTLHFWFYLDAFPGGDTGLFDNQWGNDNAGGFQILIQGSSGNMVSYAGDLTGRQSVGNGGLSTGVWYCYIIEADAINDTLTVWINNQQAAQNTGFTKNTVDGGTTNAGSYRFFANSQENNYLDGKGFNVMLWDRRLTPFERTFLYSRPFGMYLPNRMLTLGYVPLTITPISVSDSGSSVDSPSILAQIPISDSGASNEVATILATFGVSDIGISSELLDILSTFSLSDSGAGLDIVSVLSQIAVVDSGLASEALTFLVDVILSDSAIASEALSLLAQIATSDSGSATEAISILASLAISDNGVLALEAVNILVQVAQSDAAVATEALGVLVDLAVADSGTGSELVSILVNLAVSDSGVGTDIVSILAQIVLNDNGNANEAIDILAQLAINDSVVGSEALVVLTQVILSETILSSEALSILTNFVISDSGIANDVASILYMISVSDSGVASEVASILLMNGLYMKPNQLSDRGVNLYNRATTDLYNKR